FRKNVIFDAASVCRYLILTEVQFEGDVHFREVVLPTKRGSLGREKCKNRDGAVFASDVFLEGGIYLEADQVVQMHPPWALYSDNGILVKVLSAAAVAGIQNEGDDSSPAMRTEERVAKFQQAAKNRDPEAEMGLWRELARASERMNNLPLYNYAGYNVA